MPTSTQATSGTRARIAGSARIRISWPFHWRMLPTTPMTGRSGARPSAARTSAAGRAGATSAGSRPFGIVCRLPGPKPCATRLSWAAREMQRIAASRGASRRVGNGKRSLMPRSWTMHGMPASRAASIQSWVRVIELFRCSRSARSRRRTPRVARGGHEEQERVQSALHHGQRQQQRPGPAGAAEARGEAERRRLGHEAGRRGPLEPAPEGVLALEDHHRLVAAAIQSLHEEEQAEVGATDRAVGVALHVDDSLRLGHQSRVGRRRGAQRCDGVQISWRTPPTYLSQATSVATLTAVK